MLLDFSLAGAVPVLALVFDIAAGAIFLRLSFSKKSAQISHLIYYRMLCIGCIVSGLIYLLSIAPFFADFRDTAMQLVNSCLFQLMWCWSCLHIYVQVRHHAPTMLMKVLCLYGLPVLCIFAGIHWFVHPLPEVLTILMSVVSTATMVIVVVKSHQLVFHVLYHTSRQMRKRGYLLLGGVLFTLAVPITIGAVLNIDTSSTSIVSLENIVLTGFAVSLIFFHGAYRFSPPEEITVSSYGFVMDNLSTMVLMVNNKLQILDWNQKLRDSTFPVPEHKQLLSEYREKLLQDERISASPHNQDILAVMENGEETQYLFNTNAASSQGQDVGYLVEIHEVTPIYSIISYFKEAATLDNLTQLFSRNAYMRILPDMMRPQNMPLLVMVGDVDHLKEINDTYGHLRGDQLLQTAAERLRQVAPEQAFLARLGGDEFVILVPNGQQGDFIHITQTLDEMNKATGDDICNPHISWGYTLISDANEEYSAAFAQADEMMYANKAAWYTEQNIERRQNIAFAE